MCCLFLTVEYVLPYYMAVADKRDKNNFERREDALRPQFMSAARSPAYHESPNQSSPNQSMEPKSNSMTKVILIFVLGFVAGFAVSETSFLERPGSESEDEVRRGSDEVAGIEEEGGSDSSFENTTVVNATGTVVREDENANTLVDRDRTDASAISVESQPAGETVIVKRLLLGSRSWIVVHEDERGRPGGILGAARFTSGTHTEVSVELLRSTEPGGVYYAMIHSDDGDELFDPKLDTHLPDETGSPLMVRFSALGS